MKEPRHDTRRREAAVVQLRIAGNTFDQIATQLGLSGRSSANRIYRRVLDATVAEPAAELRQLEGARLDALQAQWWPRAVDGNYRAAQIILKLMERRARLFGLDAPQRVNVNTTEVDAEIVALMDDLAAAAAAGPAAEHAQLMAALDELNRPPMILGYVVSDDEPGGPREGPAAAAPVAS